MDAVVDWKAITRKQWSADPCGSGTSDAAFGTREYFEAVERYRYDVYSPWMKRDLGFDRYPGKRLLEVGVGMGSDHAQWARGGAVCTGVDLVPRCVEITKQRFALLGLHSELQVMDAEQLEFPDDSFDVVYSFGVLHHTPNTQEAVDEIHRVLKPGGRAIVMLYHRDSWHLMMKLALMQGIFAGGFANRTLHDMLGEGEYAADRQALPLVKTYSRAEAMFLFRRFRKVDNMVRQLTRGELCAPVDEQAYEPRTVEMPPLIEVKNWLRGFAAVPREKQFLTLPPPSVSLWRVLFEAILETGREISDAAVEELGAIMGWNVVIFADK